MKAPVTHSEEGGGGVSIRVKAHDRVRGGVHYGRFMAWERGGAAAREEAATLPAHRGRKEKGGGTRPGGLARPAWPLGAGWASSACLAARGRVGWLGHWAGWVRKLKKTYFLIKRIEFFEFTKALEICTRRFRRNFEVGIFPKFF
jgi:hypothetical protein